MQSKTMILNDVFSELLSHTFSGGFCDFEAAKLNNNSLNQVCYRQPKNLQSKGVFQ